MDSIHARDLFVLILMQTGQRVSPDHDTSIDPWSGARGSGSCLVDHSFKTLIALSNAVLYACELKEDFANARGLLQVSMNYYRLADTKEGSFSSSGFSM